MAYFGYAWTSTGLGALKFFHQMALDVPIKIFSEARRCQGQEILHESMPMVHPSPSRRTRNAGLVDTSRCDDRYPACSICIPVASSISACVHCTAPAIGLRASLSHLCMYACWQGLRLTSRFKSRDENSLTHTIMYVGNMSIRTPQYPVHQSIHHPAQTAR